MWSTGLTLTPTHPSHPSHHLHPFLGLTSIPSRWVGEEDWTYTGTFSLPTSALDVAKAELDVEGLDTVAEVVLNGVHIGSSTNMFVRCFIRDEPYTCCVLV